MSPQRVGGKHYLLDTDAVSFYISGKTKVIHFFEKSLGEGCSIALNHVTYYEIIRGLKAKSLPHKERQFHDFLEKCELLPLDLNVWEIAAGLYAELYQRGKLIPDDDLFIASSAIRFHRVLVTNNIRHFSRIPGLFIENWTQ